LGFCLYLLSLPLHSSSLLAPNELILEANELSEITVKYAHQRLQRAQLLVGPVGEQERECSVPARTTISEQSVSSPETCWGSRGQQRASDRSSPEVGVLGGEDGEELVDGDAELQIPPQELQLVVLLPGRLQLHDPQVARNRPTSSCRSMKTQHQNSVQTDRTDTSVPKEQVINKLFLLAQGNQWWTSQARGEAASAWR
jgi:hypothetical protein